MGKIAIFDFQAYVAVERGIAKQALQRLNDGKIKGRSLRVRILLEHRSTMETLPRAAPLGAKCQHYLLRIHRERAPLRPTAL